MYYNDTIWYDTKWCIMLLYDTIQYNIIQLHFTEYLKKTLKCTLQVLNITIRSFRDIKGFTIYTRNMFKQMSYIHSGSVTELNHNRVILWRAVQCVVFSLCIKVDIVLYKREFPASILPSVVGLVNGGSRVSMHRNHTYNIDLITSDYRYIEISHWKHNAETMFGH